LKKPAPRIKNVVLSDRNRARCNRRGVGRGSVKRGKNPLWSNTHPPLPHFSEECEHSPVVPCEKGKNLETKGRYRPTQVHRIEKKKTKQSREWRPNPSTRLVQSLTKKKRFQTKKEVTSNSGFPSPGDPGPQQYPPAGKTEKQKKKEKKKAPIKKTRRKKKKN